MLLILPLFTACVVGLFQNGLQPPCHIQLYLCALKIFSPSGWHWAWGRAKTCRVPNLLSQMGNHWVAVLGQKLPGSQGHWTLRIAVV